MIIIIIIIIIPFSFVNVLVQLPSGQLQNLHDKNATEITRRHTYTNNPT